MLKYLSLLLIASPLCLASERRGDVDIHTHSPSVLHKKMESSHYSAQPERRMAELTKLEEQAKDLAKIDKISDEAIDKALNNRRLIIKTRTDLVHVEFHITSKGSVVFHNNL